MKKMLAVFGEKGIMGKMPKIGVLSSQLNKVALIIAYFQFIDHYPQYDII